MDFLIAIEFGSSQLLGVRIGRYEQHGTSPLARTTVITIRLTKNVPLPLNEFIGPYKVSTKLFKQKTDLLWFLIFAEFIIVRQIIQNFFSSSRLYYLIMFFNEKEYLKH